MFLFLAVLTAASTMGLQGYTILLNFTIAIRTYFQKIADREDVAPTSAVTFTINHIAAVFLPALGGFLWMIDYRIPFLMGVASLVLTNFIRLPGEGGGEGGI